jgi:hypothetical protein
MPEKRKGWRWWQKLGLAGLVCLGALLVVVLGLRLPWIRPVPGVRLEPSRPSLTEEELGPETAYALLKQALANTANENGNPSGIWTYGWHEAEGKLEAYPWPSTPPATDPSAEAAGGPALGWDGPRRYEQREVPTPWTRAQYDDILRLQALFEPRMAVLDQALAAPDPTMPPLAVASPNTETVNGCRRLVRWLAISAQMRAASGDPAGAAKDMERALGLCVLIGRGGGLLHHMAGASGSAIACRGYWNLAYHYDLPAPILRELAQQCLLADGEAEPFVEAVRIDSQTLGESVARIYRDASLALFVSGGPLGLSRAERMGRRFLFRSAALAGSTPGKTEANLRCLYQHFVDIASRPYGAAADKEYSDLLDEVRRWDRRQLATRVRDPIGCLSARVLVQAFQRSHLRSAHQHAMLRSMAAFLAVKAYEKEHGSAPERLDELVPDYLPLVPIDPFDGQPLRYLRSGVLRLPANTWAIYSIGGDLTDGGGDASNVGGMGTMPGLDVVWPARPYPEPVFRPGGMAR